MLGWLRLFFAACCWCGAVHVHCTSAVATDAATGSVESPPQHVVGQEVVAALWPADPFATGFSLGNHRVEVDVPAALRSRAAVQVHVVWRRRSQPNATIIVATRPVTEQYANASVLRNVAVLQSTMHDATIVFEPDGASSVHLYYLPYDFSGGSGGYASRFGAAVPADVRPDDVWLAKYSKSAPSGTPWVDVSAFAARTEFDSFTIMEQAASPAEVAAMLAAAGNPPFVLFTEKRTNSIRMNDALPISWLRRTNRTTVLDTVQPDEFYVFQVGVYAAADRAVTVESFRVSPSSLRPAITCFNLGGTRFNGTTFTQAEVLNASQVGALWFGVDVGSSTGTTSSSWLNATVHLTLSVAGGEKQEPNVAVSLAISDSAPIKGKGDFDPWRLSRLRWLDSTEGRDYNVSKGYIPLKVSDAEEDTAHGRLQPDHFTLDMLDRTIKVNRSTGLPASILVNQKEILAAPMEFLATDSAGQTSHVMCDPKHSSQPKPLGEGTTVWASQCTIATLTLTVHVTASYEGYLDVVTSVSNDGTSSVALQDLRLVVNLLKETATFMMGLGAVSGYRPSPEIAWPWSALGIASDFQNASVKKYGPMNPGDAVPQAWLGRVDRGLRIALKGTDPSWESPEDYPKSATALSMTDWSNCMPAHGADPVNRTLCKGVVSVAEVVDQTDGRENEEVVRFGASLGSFVLSPGEFKLLPFDLLVTPLKPFNLSQHFSTRYWHFGGEFPPPESGLSTDEAIEQMVELNITWVVIHQGSNLNPYINYPLRSDLMGQPSLQQFVDACHAKGIFVKLYFTTRELSNRCTEIFALKALPRHEVLFGVDGTSGQEGGGVETGGGGAWLQEHLGGDYKVAWSTVGYPWLSGIKGVRADEAVADDGASRWDNFYVEANRFLLQSPGTDGVYLDAVAFDRTTMERIRKNMERLKDNVRVDIHRSGGWFCHGPGYGTPALRYMQHFAWADSLWFGEGFDYWGQSPEWWLLESSGLPFGLTGDMIREGTVGPDGGCTQDGCLPTAGMGCPDPNRWLGMVFGMGTRLAWGGLGTNMSAVLASPEVKEVVPLWRFWKDWGLGDTQMLGWWDDEVPVTTSDPLVKATAYVKADLSMLIALGNFGPNATTVTLTFKDGKARKLSARAIDAYQPAREFDVGVGSAITNVPVQAKGGWLLERAA